MDKRQFIAVSVYLAKEIQKERGYVTGPLLVSRLLKCGYPLTNTRMVGQIFRHHLDAEKIGYTHEGATGGNNIPVWKVRLS